MDIKQEELIRFWTWCGFKEHNKYFHYELSKRVKSWVDSLGELSNKDQCFGRGNLPELTLDNIYKWAIPKLQEKGYIVELTALEHKGFEAKILSIFQSSREPEEYYEPIAEFRADNPKEALYQAIMKVIDSEVTK